MKLRIALAALAAVASHAAAQPAPRPDPADPAVAVPTVRYESAFAGYNGSRDEPLAPWRAVNDEVARAGGHVGILKAGSSGTRRPSADKTTGAKNPAAAGAGARAPRK